MQFTEQNILNFSPSCVRNQQHIAEQFDRLFTQPTSLLEIGSYSAQHALYICQQRDHINWQPTDQQPYLDSIRSNIAHQQGSNINQPFELDVANKTHWPTTQFDAVYTANTLHIMSWQHVELLFKHISRCVKSSGKLCVYGPFKYNGEYTSPSNHDFNLWLEDRDALSGIRDFEHVNELALAQGFCLVSDIDMPANNQFLIWQKL